MNLKHSIYNYPVKHEDKTIIFNTFSGALALFNEHEIDKFNNFHNFYDEDINTWKANGFLVEENFNELEVINYCRTKDTFANNKTTYRILTTTACNARCFYCYEENVKVETMTKEVADNVISFIAEKSMDKKKIVLSWFGGEPLANYKIITYITDNLKERLPNTDIVSFITTNGSLFNDKIIKEAKEKWNLRSIQITLDGLEKTYNERKNYVNILNGFEKVLNNITNLLKNDLGVTIRLNYDKNNYEEITNLIKFLGDKYKKYKNLRCYAYPLFNACESDCSSSYLSNDSKFLNLINNTLFENNFTKDLVLPRKKLNSCFATFTNSFVITPTGDLYKCAMAIKDPNQKVGNVNEPIQLSSALMKWQNPEVPKKCQTCKLLPICEGGCRAARILNLKMNDCTIHKLTIDQLLVNYVNSKLKERR